MTPDANAALILDLVEAFRRSKTMFTAVRLGIFDALAETPHNLDSLARRFALHRGGLLRLLSGCVALGLLHCEDGMYRNTEAARRFLTTASSDTLAGYIRYSDQSLYPLWGRLEEAVRTGANRWEEVFGSRTALFDHYFRDEQSAASFIGGMHGFGQLASQRVVTAFDLSRFQQLVDLGGATGHLCTAACAAWPHLHATVLDLPAVEKYARAHMERSASPDRIEFLAADFFADPLPPADLYSLGRILHDWTDEKITRLLDKIVASLPSGGALLIAETLLSADKSGPLYSAMQDLNMLVCTEGRERTRAEYQQLLHAAGFSDINFKQTGSLVDAILAIKG
jgi:acetylserotonin N-methyltransferase